MSQQFLNGADVVTALQKVCGKGMPKRVAGRPLHDAGDAGCDVHRPLDGTLVKVVAVVLPIDAIMVVSLGGEHPLPSPGGFQSRIFACQCRWQLYAAAPALNFTCMLSLPFS